MYKVSFSNRLLLVCLFFSCCFSCKTFAQGTTKIPIQNPSFEGIAREANTPKGWHPYGSYSTPDILPGVWGVTMQAKEGKTFVGLTAREDNTFESLGQALTVPLKANECYTVEIDLARSDAYASYNRPIRLRFWGGIVAGQKKYLLGSSPTVANTAWKRYSVYFFPKNEIKYLILEAYYADGFTAPYRGNILLDNLGTIETCIRADVTPVGSDF
jgi:hypothetical protein